MKKSVIMFLAVILVFSVFVSCDGDNVDDVFCARVIFDANGGEGTMADQALLGSSGNLKPNEFTRLDYLFVGWNTEKDGSGEDFENEAYIEVENSITLYAQWLENIDYIFISYYPNGGTGDEVHGVAVRNRSYTLDTNEFTREAYEFIGWALEPDGEVVYEDGETVILPDDTAFYAQWNKLRTQLTVTYHGNGETSGEMGAELSDFNTDYTLAENAFVKDGHKFLGWSTSAEGEVEYEEGETIDVEEDDLDFYAVWKELSKLIGCWSNGFEVLNLEDEYVGTWNPSTSTTDRDITYDEETIYYEKTIEGTLGQGYAYVSSDETHVLICGNSLESLEQNELDEFIKANGTDDFILDEEDGIRSVYIRQVISDTSVFEGFYNLDIETGRVNIVQMWSYYDGENLLYVESVEQEDLLGKLPDSELEEKFFLYMWTDTELEDLHYYNEYIFPMEYNESEDSFVVPGISNIKFERVL